MPRLPARYAGLVLLGLLTFIGLSVPAEANTGATFEVSATIVAGCAVDGVGTSGDAGLIGTLDFGRDTTLSTATHNAALGANQTIVLRCTPGVSLSLKLGGG